MSDFCDFVPDDPSCQQAPPPEEGGQPLMEDGGKGDKDDRQAAVMEANITFLVVGLVHTAAIGLKMFRYRSASTYYDNGDVLGTNYWKYASQLSGYFWLAGMGIATVTQLLSMFGIANEINLLVWTVGLGGIGELVSLVTSILMFLAWDKAY